MISGHMMNIGHLFKLETGRDIDSCLNIMEVEELVSSRFGKDRLDIKPFPSSLVPAHGNVFPVSDTYVDLDKEIDARMDRMRRVC